MLYPFSFFQAAQHLPLTLVRPPHFRGLLLQVLQGRDTARNPVCGHCSCSALSALLVLLFHDIHYSDCVESSLAYRPPCNNEAIFWSLQSFQHHQHYLFPLSNSHGHHRISHTRPSLHVAKLSLHILAVLVIFATVIFACSILYWVYQNWRFGQKFYQRIKAKMRGYKLLADLTESLPYRIQHSNT